MTAASTTTSTPARSPIRTHGPLLLPKIRDQDQAFESASTTASPSKRVKTSSPVRRSSSRPASKASNNSFRPAHTRSFTNPESVACFSAAQFTADDSSQPSLLCTPVNFLPTPDDSPAASRRASTCGDIVDNASAVDYTFPTYPLPAYVPTPGPDDITQAAQPQSYLSRAEAFLYQPYAGPRAPSPLAAAAPIAAEPVPQLQAFQPVPSTTLLSYLTAPNPAPALVRTISFPLRDPNNKHFWWDVRQIRPWTTFTASTILSLPGAADLVSCPVPAPCLPVPSTSQRHPETEAALHAIYASHYLPKLNSALALSSRRALQLSFPSAKTVNGMGMAMDCMFTANVAGDAASAAALFGGKPTARVVGLVRSFDRFNTGMRVEGNIKRVEYLRSLAQLHHAMREHGCRYGFILTEIELVFVRNGAEATPHFGYLEVGSVQLAAHHAGAAAGDRDGSVLAEVPLTACLALWGLCRLAGDEPMGAGQAHWRAEVGAPAEGTRRKALPRDDWMPQPQLAEKREAKRARGWVWPEDAVGRKEMGKRGVRYASC